MKEQNKSSKGSWWQTIPGMLTALAAVITAITGLIGGLYQAGWFSEETHVEPVSQVEPVPGAEPVSRETIEQKPVPPEKTVLPEKGMGRVTTTQGSFPFDRITGMSMGNGQLTVSESGAKIEVPLKTIASITFLEDEMVSIKYRDGQTENAVFFCYWNTPVTFYSGKKKIYYGDCAALGDVRAIEFFQPD